MLTSMKEGIAQANNTANKELLETATKLWMLRVYRSDEFVEMTNHPLVEMLMEEFCYKLEKRSLELLRIIGPDDFICGSPFADPDGKGMEKYLEMILSQPANQRVDWWERLLDK